MSELLIPPQEPLDEHWHHELGRFDMPNDLYAYLMPSPAELEVHKQRFYDSGLTDVPVLRPPETYRAHFESSLSGLLQLRDTVEGQEPNEHVRALYIDRIDELAANCRIWLAAADQDAAAFEEANVFLYGTPDKTIYADSCAWLRAFASEQVNHPDRAVATAAQAVLAYIPDSRGNPNGIVPDEATYHTLHSLHTQPGAYFDQLFAGTALPADSITQEEGDIILEQVLANLGIAYTPADSPDGFWSIQHGTQNVLRPAGYVLRTESFVGLVSHEVGSHLLERVNGHRSGLRLASSGLDRYEHGNEGRAYIREQIALNSLQAAQRHYSWEFSIAKHLGISLAVGLQGRRYTFAEVHDVIKALYTLWYALQQPDLTTARQAAQEQAWAITVRLLKGTAGQGDAYRKDIVYLEGNVRCWRALKQHPALLFIGDRGKFDITNQKHLHHLAALGVIPQNS